MTESTIPFPKRMFTLRDIKVPMALVTVNLSKHIKDTLDALVKKGVSPTRSAAIRLALCFGLPHLVKMIKAQEVIIEKKYVSNMNNNRVPPGIIYIEMPNKTFQKYKKVGTV